MEKISRKLKGCIAYDLGLLKQVFYRKTGKYLSKHYSNSKDDIVTPRKTLIYMLDGRAYSGGLSDIMKGIVSMYKYSKEIGFDFRINFCFPYNLNNYLIPNSHNWQISEGEISYNSNSTAYLWIYNSHLSYGKSREFEIHFQRKFLNKFLKRNKTKRQFHIYTNSDWADGSDYSVLFNELFKPTENVQNVLQYHKKRLTNEYVSITFRFQQLLGDFVISEISKDKTLQFLQVLKKQYKAKNKELPEHGETQLRAILGDFKRKKISVELNDEEKKKLIKKCFSKIEEIRINFFSKSKILITADSESFLEAVKGLVYTYVIIGQTVEEEKQTFTEQEKDMFLKAYIDILLLSDAKKLHLFKTGPMYLSGFAKNASLIKNKEYEEIIF